MSTNASLFSELEKSTHRLIVAYEQLKQEKEELQSELQKTKNSLKEAYSQTKELEETNQQMKIVNAMLGSSEHRRLMKLRLNKIIKEVDACIAEVKKQKI